MSDTPPARAASMASGLMPEPDRDPLPSSTRLATRCRTDSRQASSRADAAVRCSSSGLGPPVDLSPGGPLAARAGPSSHLGRLRAATPTAFPRGKASGARTEDSKADPLDGSQFWLSLSDGISLLI
uniref:Uncharacterized protein n=1 Tax=Tetraselmis sp. GSL018 TaxID=582737 RepID=A0A061RSM0_9CHLO